MQSIVAFFKIDDNMRSLMADSGRQATKPEKPEPEDRHRMTRTSKRLGGGRQQFGARRQKDQKAASTGYELDMTDMSGNGDRKDADFERY